MPSNVTYTCIPCRFSAKQTSKCPNCYKPMTYMGKAFKPPKKTNDSQWRKVEMLISHDIRFGYCSCHRGRRNMRSTADAKNICGSRRSANKHYSDLQNVTANQLHRRRVWKAREYGF